jgi:hypothetical protein
LTGNPQDAGVFSRYTTAENQPSIQLPWKMMEVIFLDVAWSWLRLEIAWICFGARRFLGAGVISIFPRQGIKKGFVVFVMIFMFLFFGCYTVT